MNKLPWTSASEILRNAALLIEEKGLQQKEPLAVEEHCLATGLEAAFRTGEYSIVDFNYAREAVSRVIGVPREPEEIDGDELDVPYWGRNLMDWNDREGRTAEEVVDTLRKASSLAAEFAARTDVEK